MQQGSTIAPRALSTRCVSGVWLVLPTETHAHIRALHVFSFLNPLRYTPIQFCSVLILGILFHLGMHFIFDVSWKFYSRFPGHQGSR